MNVVGSPLRCVGEANESVHLLVHSAIDLGIVRSRTIQNMIGSGPSRHLAKIATGRRNVGIEHHGPVSVVLANDARLSRSPVPVPGRGILRVQICGGKDPLSPIGRCRRRQIELSQGQPRRRVGGCRRRPFPGPPPLTPAVWAAAAASVLSNFRLHPQEQIVRSRRGNSGSRLVFPGCTGSPITCRRRVAVTRTVSRRHSLLLQPLGIPPNMSPDPSPIPVKKFRLQIPPPELLLSKL
mmetsp:Transcript_4196/g.9529  ORF Transcript_4196/g.9529 Transcript_4196/m.9529 type:complete len:238 (+) Transcript_4196:710-1423(+)